MTIVMRGSPTGAGDSPHDAGQPQQGSPLPQTSPAQSSSSSSSVTQQQSSAVPSTSSDMTGDLHDTPSPQSDALTDTSPSQQLDESGGQGDGKPDSSNDDGDDMVFPASELGVLDEMISRPRWVVPVLPKGELEILLKAAIELCKKGVDIHSEDCQRFFRDGLTISFTKILNDDAVSGWKFEIHKCILKNAEKLIELCVTKLNQDWYPLLDLLSMVLNPSCKFHMFNGNKLSESVPAGNQLADNELFARPPDSRTPKGWLVDLVNRFGQLNGFQLLLDRIVNGSSLCVPVITALLRPFGLCYEVLTPHTVQTYFMPIVEYVPKFLDGLTDEELKKESKIEAKNDALSGIIKALKSLVARVPKQEETIKGLEIFRLKMILRLLQISSFNGKMNALNEVNKVITSVSYYPHRHGPMEDDEWLTAEKMAEWIEENNVLSVVLRDSLHQPQYVEKLEKIIRFMIKEKALTLANLDCIWEAQAGKHEAIVKNVHDLLAKLAWDFSPEQLDHLFQCFQGNWAHASKKQREKLLELIRRLAEDDKEGVMAHKVLGLLWNLAHSEDVPTDIMDQALAAQIKILDFSCSQDRDTQKTQWINRFVEELKNDKWVLPALKQIRDICQLFNEAPQNFPHTHRNQVISHLQSKHSIVMLISQNLSAYMTKACAYAKENPDVDPVNILPDGRFSHIEQINERLKFLRFLLKDGQLWLCEPQAKQIWVCLAENSIYPSDRESCFKWFSKLMGEEPDLDPEITKDFLEQNILQFDPSLLTENGMNCFERFFKAVNSKEGRIVARRRSGYMMDDLDLIGLEYLWRVVLYGTDEVADKAIVLLKDIHTNLGPRLQSRQVTIHEDLLQYCTDRLKASYDTLTVLDSDKDGVNRIHQETSRMIRVMTVLREYVAECDDAYGEERAIIPLGRAFRGTDLMLLVRFPNQGRQVDDLDIWTHTNDSIGSIRRQVLNRVKANNSNVKVDLYLGGEPLDQSDDRKLISQLAIRDKTLITAKLSQVGSNMPSSPESSSDSSTGSPHHVYDGPNIEAENCLPGVLMSNNACYAQFMFQLADLGSRLHVPKLRECAGRILQLMPPDVHTVETLQTICEEFVKSGEAGISPKLEAVFFGNSSSQVLYMIVVTYALLMPVANTLSDEAFVFQCNFVRSGGVPIVLNMLTKNNFLPNADLQTFRSAYLVILKIAKLLLTAVGNALVQSVADMLPAAATTTAATTTAATTTAATTTTATTTAGTANAPPAIRKHAVILLQALRHIPNPSSDSMMRNVAIKIGQHLGQKATGCFPDLTVVRAVQKIAWTAANGTLGTLLASGEPAGPAGPADDAEDVNVCREALEVLTVCLVVGPHSLDTLNKDKSWQTFIIDLLLLCRSRGVRISSCEQFALMATKCCAGPMPLIFFITLLFTVLGDKAKDNAKQSHEYFQLLCRLLNYACTSQKTTLPTAEALLNNEITWLKKVRETLLKTDEVQVDEALLEGHLGVTCELLALQTTQRKYHIGSESGGANLIKELVEDFIFPASKIVRQCRDAKTGLPADQAIPVCSSSLTVTAAFDLLVAQCSGCVQNLRFLSSMLNDIYYTSNEKPLVEWEYLPPIGPRPNKGFVGLKNAGATCYMNSVLQQLFMIDPVRFYILGVEGAADDNMEDYEGDEKENETNVDQIQEERKDEEKTIPCKEDGRKEYNLVVLKHVQAIFAHLACSKLQYYVPRGFWKHFRLWGEPVNLREQHDALEFFNSLVDSLDEALKSLGYTAILTKVMGGSFADQKICKDCPHRYSREESFTALNIDIRNQQNLLESLEQYVKGDLLEGANAYHCDKCNKKVDTVKRLCIKKLPPILAIQLKRFDYDWERETAIKFNDYFEFPREFDMEPFTVQGLAKIEGELIADDDGEEKTREVCTKYRLVGVVVHSGQASGGHYYSYILHRVGEPKWYKFDDGDVTEWKMEDEEEMKNQCFGGEYVGEVYDHMMKRKLKKWWNAYILFYERMDEFEQETEKELTKSLQDLTIENRTSQVPMPTAIERCVRKQNIQFMHNRNQFSTEYFHFVRKLLLCNTSHVQLLPGHDKLTPEAEELAMISVQLGAKFLFSIGLHTKKTLRGPACEWYDALSVHLQHSKNVRNWFAQNILFAHPHRFSEYLLECPSSEVRNAFMKIIVFLAHFSLQDGPSPSAVPLGSGYTTNNQNVSLSDHLLVAVLNLLNKEVSEHGRSLTQYFHLFLMYANLGIAEKRQLLQLGVPATFVLVALDDGPGPAIKYQFAELAKLYSVVSQLVRCCDITACCNSSIAGQAPMKNPHGDPTLTEPLMTIQPQVEEVLFKNTRYVKKLIEECNSSEETTKILKYCSWENPHFSSAVLSELLWQVAYVYTYELRPYLDLLLQMLLLDDSWQNHRIHNALKGIPDDRDGLFDTIQRSKNHYQKRAYQCIKMMVSLFTHCAPAAQMLQTNTDLKRKWTWAVEWLHDELDRRHYSGSNAQYNYSNWSPPPQSNETTNGYFLERSHSAKLTLAKAVELVPEEEAAERDESREEDGSTHPDTATGRPAPNCTTYTVTTQPQSTLTATQPATSAATQAATSATTPPATQPTTPPATQPTTQPAMQPSTQQSTPQSPQQSTQPSTQQSPQKQLHKLSFRVSDCTVPSPTFAVPSFAPAFAAPSFAPPAGTSTSTGGTSTDAVMLDTTAAQPVGVNLRMPTYRIDN